MNEEEKGSCCLKKSCVWGGVGAVASDSPPSFVLTTASLFEFRVYQRSPLILIFCVFRLIHLCS